MTPKTDIFVPPGIQANLWHRLGTIPRQATPAIAKKIKALWQTRNNAPEEQLQAIDAKMEQIVIDYHLRQNSSKPRAIFETYDLHGTGSKRCKVWVMPVRRRWNYWANVTNVKCPYCDGKIRWYEAGYVPGYRICDGCRRTFLARGDQRLPKLILDLSS